MGANFFGVGAKNEKFPNSKHQIPSKNAARASNFGFRQAAKNSNKLSVFSMTEFSSFVEQPGLIR